jgi:hypothetical protein
MTFSAPLKIIVACFAIAALVATAMNGSESSAGLKGTRMLQQGFPRGFPSFTGISPFNAVNSVNSNSQNIINQLSPAISNNPRASVIATNTVVAQSNNIFRYFNP